MRGEGILRAARARSRFAVSRAKPSVDGGRDGVGARTSVLPSAAGVPWRYGNGRSVPTAENGWCVAELPRSGEASWSRPVAEKAESAGMMLFRGAEAVERKPMKRTTLLVTFVVLATAAGAHQDRILSIHPDGAIPELPSAYQTTRLHVAFSEGDAGALRQLTFLSSGRETSVQPCLLRLVPTGSFRQLYLTGSWYHDESIVPHYVHVAFLESRPQDLQNYVGVHFVFSLRDASLFKVTQVIFTPAQGPQDRDIRLSNGCPDR
jgi:hypothetical protein